MPQYKYSENSENTIQSALRAAMTASAPRAAKTEQNSDKRLAGVQSRIHTTGPMGRLTGLRTQTNR